MKHLFIPSEKNNHTPHLLSKSAIFTYILVVFTFNFFVTSLGLVKTNASFELEELLQAHNQQRLLNGLPELRLNNVLSQSATNKGNTMLSLNCWSHYCPPEKNWTTYFDEVGYVYVHAGENLAEGFSTTDTALNAWMNSETHRANILNPNFTEVGFGVITGDFQGRSGNTIIVVHFGTSLDTFIAEDTINSVQVINPTISVTNPVNNSVINDPKPVITGDVEPADSDVRIDINNQEAGRVQAEGKNYSFRPVTDLQDGQHTIKSMIVDGLNNILGESSEVSITVDTMLPFIFDDSYIAEKESDSGNLKLDFQVNEELANLYILETQTKPVAGDNSYYSLILTDIEYNSGFTIALVDKAGNTNEIKLTTQFINNLLARENSDGVVETGIIDLSIFTSIFENISDRGIKVAFAAMFIVYLIILLVIDFVVLARTNMLNVTRSKSHLHLSSFVIILILLIIGGTSGTILHGTNL